jgi:peptidyl-prolyl cis-trans isomerase C
MKARIVFVTLLIGCGKDEKIEGKVQDIFGNPIKDVTVKIQTSTFSAKTDESGNYSLDYAPGSMKLVFSKEGYTTGILDLNIQQKTYFPAEILGLCPIPSESGIFYVDFENKRLIKIEENGRIEIQEQSETPNRPWDGTIKSYTVKFFKSILTIKTGKAMFIDRIPYQLMLSTVMENGLIYKNKGDIMIRSEEYSGFLQDSQSNIGVENLLIRTVELNSGTYAWIEADSKHIGENAFGFQVGETTAKESKSPDDSIPKSNEAPPLPQSEEIKTPNANQQTIQTPSTESSATTTVAPAPASTTIDKADAVAVVNGQYIAKSALTDLEKEVATRSQGQTFPKEKLIEELIQRQLLIQDALQKKLDQSPDILNQPENVRNTLLTQAALQNYLKTNPVTDAELKAEYDSKVGGTNATEYKASHILVKTEDEAKKLIVELDKGAKFADLANKHSLDAKESQNGGDLGWFAAGQMVAPFSEAAAKLEKGKYSKEPVKTQFGYHIILREDSRAQTPPSFNAVKEQLKPVLERKKVQKMVEDMRKQAKVEILVSLADEKTPAEPTTTTAVASTSSPEKTQVETTQASPTNSTAQISSPSFDCAKASTGSERLICSNANLAAADVEMARIYKQVINNTIDKKTLKREQNQWRKEQRDACKDVSCILNSYAVRTKQLKEKQAN